MENYDLPSVLNKYLHNRCTPEETRWLWSRFGTRDEQDLMRLVMQELRLEEPADTERPDQERLDRRYRQIQQQLHPRPRLWPRIAAAASVILLLGTGAYFVLHPNKQALVARHDPEQLAPMQKGVTLTLSGGQVLTLARKHTGALSQQATQQDSVLRYHAAAQETSVKMNTLANNGSAPFSVDLADGTVATLDINSTLTYPEAFKGASRQVRMSGQVYFKVRHDAAHPFSVIAGNDRIEDIGTEFNVNSYEQAKTTLVSGLIKVSEDERSVTLKPGEQVAGLIVKTVRLEDVTAWLQGQLIFHHEPLENILKNVARIYGVTIVWVDPETKRYTFGGSVSRTDQLANVLNYFRKAGRVDFKVEGRTVKVFKKHS